MSNTVAKSMSNEVHFMELKILTVDLKKLNCTYLCLTTVSCPWKNTFALKLLIVFVKIAVAFVDTSYLLTSTLETKKHSKSNHWKETET
jgi:hypothetical protein